jgi:hypothetical protein
MPCTAVLTPLPFPSLFNPLPFPSLSPPFPLRFHSSSSLPQFLTGPSKEAIALRDRFVFKVVPMLNADGVIHGNYR